MCNMETRSVERSGECLDCGFNYFTKEDVMDFNELNSTRVDCYELKPLTKKQYKKNMEKVLILLP